MAKAIALITLLLAALITLPAWGQDDSGSDDQGIEASDEVANEGEDASAADQAVADEDVDDEAVLEEIADMDEGDAAGATGDDGMTADDDASPGPTDSSEVPPDTTGAAPAGCPHAPTATAGSNPPTGADSGRRGTVKMFDEAKGFGFIVDNSSREEIYVHMTGLMEDICPGDVVTFETREGKKGLQAVDVRRI